MGASNQSPVAVMSSILIWLFDSWLSIPSSFELQADEEFWEESFR